MVECYKMLLCAGRTMIENVFIAWSGNKELADELAKIFNANGDMKPVVGGGLPVDTFIGAQVLDQINRCNWAILLVEDKNGAVSPNLMFEWGYIMARQSAKNVHAFLINKSPRDLPSDLLGSWATKIDFDRNKDDLTDVAKSIYDIFKENTKHKKSRIYFDLISNWKNVYVYLTDDLPDTNQEICEYILSGCLAAYYYPDNRVFRHLLSGLTVSEELNSMLLFAKAYVDVFLNSDNMTKPLTHEEFFKLMHIFDSTINRKHNLSEELDLFLDILCYDVYGLACSLYLRNTDIDNTIRSHCSQKAKDCYEKDIQLIEAFEEKSPANICLVALLKSYIYNDMCHLCRDSFSDMDSFLRYLAIAVDERKKLWQTFMAHYPSNTYLATKLEQEYMIALSEQCRYMEDSFMKTMYKTTIVAKYQEWEKELFYTSSLTNRIKKNIDLF